MMKIAITGGIGSGKSYVCRILEKQGIRVYDCDAEAKRLMRTDVRLQAGLKKLVGEQVYSAEGVLQKPVLAQFLLAGEANEQEHERKPSVDEIAERVDLPEDKIADAMKANSRHVSMDAPIADGEDSSMIDFLSGDSSNTDRELAIESLKAEVSRILKLLTDKEQKVLRAFFGIDGSPEMTLDEIGEKYNLTRERVRQIKEKALRRLRHNTKNKLLKSYLGQ
jgi:RNA polymerase sigma factor (sigma-70 family)